MSTDDARRQADTDDSEDADTDESRWSAAKRRWARWRDRLRERPVADLVYRIVVGVVGLAVLGLGIIAIPYPGPGWAIVFLGLAVLATEFSIAQRALKWVRARYDAAMDWFQRQHWSVQVLGGIFTALVVAATLWLLGAADWATELVGWDQPWLNSPIGFGD